MKISLRTSYQKQYYDKEHNYMDTADTNYVNNLVERLISEAKIKKHHKILEIGCGKGRFSIPLLKKGYNITCIDLSDSLLKDFKKNISSEMKVKIINEDFNKIAKKLKNKFDFIIGFYILHHLDNLEGSFRNMRIMLKKGGKIIFSENNPYNLMYYVQMMIVKDMGWKGEKGILNMRTGVMLPMLESAGFEDFSIKRYGFLPPFIVNTKWGLKLDKILEKIGIFYPVLPFQIITAKRAK